MPEGELAERFSLVSQSLGVRSQEGQTVNDRVVELFAKPLGVESVADVVALMRSAKTQAHQRSLELVAQAQEGGGLKLAEGDLVKGICKLEELRYLPTILQNGSVAKEFLGANANSDSTPFDTDVSMVSNEDAEGGFAQAYSSSLATGYGDLAFLVKNREQFQLTDATQPQDPNRSKYELFKTGAAGSRHFGVRTGFPSTEIDFMIANERILSDRSALEKIYFEIAQNGFYVPVADTSGQVIFTPEMYDQYRRTFAGLERFDGPDIGFIATESDQPHFAEISKITSEAKAGREKVVQAAEKIRGVVSSVLAAHGIALKDRFDRGLLGAELIDTGSTGRNTNSPEQFDFDLALRVDQADFEQVGDINQEIIDQLQPVENKSHGLQSGNFQIRALGVSGLADEPIDVDIMLVDKADLKPFSSDDSVKEKLDFIGKQNGEQAYEQTLANIILTKNVLAQGQAYKKVEHGGFGGIGVENWILSNGGNMTRAFESFLQAARSGNDWKPLSEFKRDYAIQDAGVNLKDGSHDNFTTKLSEAGYKAMITTISEYLETHSS